MSGDQTPKQDGGNPFQPIDTDSRLAQRPHSRSARHSAVMQPGQLYGGSASVRPASDLPQSPTGAFPPVAAFQPGAPYAPFPPPSREGDDDLSLHEKPDFTKAPLPYAPSFSSTGSFPPVYQAATAPFPPVTPPTGVSGGGPAPVRQEKPDFAKATQPYAATAPFPPVAPPTGVSGGGPAPVRQEKPDFAKATQPYAATAPFPPIAPPQNTLGGGSAVPSYLKKASLSPKPAAKGPELPSYLKKRPVLRPFPLNPSEEEEPREGVKIASTFPGFGGEHVAPVRDEIAAFFDGQGAPVPPPEEESEDFPSPAFPPERAPEEEGPSQMHSELEDAILPESAVVPDMHEGNPNYQPPAFELFSTAPGAGELNPGPVRDMLPPMPAYTPPVREEQTGTQAPEGSSNRIRQSFRPQPTGQPAKPIVKGKKPAPAPKKNKRAAVAPDAPPRPPVRWGRIAAITACAAMLIFCCVEVGWVLAYTRQKSDEMSLVERAFEESGGSLIQSASLVELPPDGQTLAPDGAVSSATVAPVETPLPNAPSPTAAPGGEAETTTARVRQTRYADNSLRNTLDSMAKLREEYPDVVGRLVIPGVLDEMVVARDNTYYLSHNYRDVSSNGGAVFMDEGCSLDAPPENLLLRGQGDVAGKTFAPLWQYRDGGNAFVRSAFTATLTTLYEEESYVLLAVITADSDSARSGYFDYSSHPSFATDSEMMAYVDSAVSRSLYRFSTDVAPSDRLLTLATVSSGENDQCIILIFRMKRKGE